MSFTPTLIPGKIFGPNEPISIPALNQLGNPTMLIVGSASTAEIDDYAITAVKSKIGAFHYGGMAGGGPSVYTLDFPAGQEAALTDGLLISFKCPGVCAIGATLNVDGTGAHLMTRFDGTQLQASDIILNQIVECRYSVVGAGHWQVLNQVPVVVSIPTPAVYTPIVGWGGDSERIFARRSGAAPNTQVQLWHYGTILRHRGTGAVMYAAPTGGMICDITVAGLGGLDTGAEAVSTWYFVWLMSDGVNQSLVLSASATAPATLGSYSYIGLVGSVFNNAAGNLHPFYQMNRRFWMLDIVIGTGLTGPGAAGGTLTIPAGTFPSNVNTVLIKAGRTDATIFIAAFGPDVSGVVVQCGCQSTSPALNGLMSAATLEVVVNSNASMFWQTADAGTTYRVVACGYTF